MDNPLFVLALVALVPLAAAPNVNADVVNAECEVVVALVDGGSLSEAFTMTACGIWVTFAVIRNPTTQTVVWTITTDLDSKTCTWPPDAGASCTGGVAPVDASVGSLVNVQIQASAGNVIGEFGQV